MSEKTIQERLREAFNAEWDVSYASSDLLREAADLIDRLTAAPSEEAIRRDEREAVFQCPNKDRGLEQCKALHTKTTTGHPLTWCQLPS